MKQSLVCVLFLLLYSQSYAQAWNKKKSEAYLQLGATFLQYDRLLNGGDPGIDLKRTIGDNTLQFYSEYGLSDKVNLVINLPYKITWSDENLNQASNDPYLSDTLESGHLSGFSNPDIGLRFSLIDKKYVLSALLSFSPSIHQYDSASGLRIGYKASLFSPMLFIGRGWTGHYLQAGMGMRFNTGNYAQNFIGMAEGGVTIKGGKTIIALRLDVKLPVTTGHFNEGNSVQTGLYRDNSSYVSPGLKFIQRLSKGLYLNLAAYGAVYSQNEGAQATLNIAVAYSR